MLILSFITATLFATLSLAIPSNAPAVRNEMEPYPAGPAICGSRLSQYNYTTQNKDTYYEVTGEWTGKKHKWTSIIAPKDAATTIQPWVFVKKGIAIVIIDVLATHISEASYFPQYITAAWNRCSDGAPVMPGTSTPDTRSDISGPAYYAVTPLTGAVLDYCQRELKMGFVGVQPYADGNSGFAICAK